MNIYHTHHIVPKHAGGTDEPSNLTELTVEEHAEAHRVLFEKYGRPQDEIAWKALSGLITKEEARRLAVSAALKGKEKSLEQRRKMSIARKRRGGITTGMKLPPCSEERKRKISMANLGKVNVNKNKKLSLEIRNKMSESAKKREKVECHICHMKMNKANFVRHKCKMETHI